MHRDIKPGNVIRRPDGSFALVDFGAVRDKLKPGGGSTVVGTFGYMAPEQFQGRASPKSDVYGLGATALAMLTGCEPEELPHEGLALDVAKAVPDGTSVAGTRAPRSRMMLEPWTPDRRVASVDEALALLAKPPQRQTQAKRKEPRAASPGRAQATRNERAPRPPREPRPQRDHLPVLARVFGRLGLLVALVAVSIVVGAIVPFALILLSLVFGGKLRRWATACVDATRRAQATLARASARLSNRATPEPPVRVAETSEVEVAGAGRRPDTACDEDADEWLDDLPERQRRRERTAERAMARARDAAVPRRRSTGVAETLRGRVFVALVGEMFLAGAREQDVVFPTARDLKIPFGIAFPPKKASFSMTRRFRALRGMIAACTRSARRAEREVHHRRGSPKQRPPFW